MNYSNQICIDGYKKISSVSNATVYGLTNALKVSEYPMQINVRDADSLPNETDIKRSISLGTTNIGEGHDNFLNGIIVQFDLTFSNKVGGRM